MYGQKLGISISNMWAEFWQKDIRDIIKIIKEVGFDAVSPSCAGGWEDEKIISAARENDLILQSLHAPYRGAGVIWGENKTEAESATKELLLSLEDARRYGIPVLVVHPWYGFGTVPAPTESGLKNFEILVNAAAKYNIKIAFENIESDVHLEKVEKHFDTCDNVGFCWDSGHEMCYSASRDMLGLFGKKLIMTHLNDNLGISRSDGKIFWTDDLHLLPFDGAADWNYNVKRLKECPRQEILNFELNVTSRPNRHENDAYSKMTTEEYFTEAYKRACKIAHLMLYKAY